MEIAAIEAISTTITEAIKILGPAIITGFIGLRVGKYQLDMKIKELENANEFKSREHLFKYYKDWQKNIKEKYESLTSALGTITGMAAAIGDNRESDSISPLMFKFFEFYMKSAPQDLIIILRDMEPLKDKYKIEYELLMEYELKSKNVCKVESVEDLFNSVSELLEIYGHLNRCAHLQVEEQAKMALQPYLKKREA